MTSRAVASVRAARSVALLAVAFTLIECTAESPSGPTVLSVRAAEPLAAKSSQGLTVSSANPPYGDQGTTIDVQIIGSGFTSGATATWLLNGVANDHVHTNSTRFVNSTEVDANITIAPDATIAFWDVQVALIGGKNGVGSDAFEVTSAQVLASISTKEVAATNDLLEVAGYYGSDAFVVDDASRFIDLGAGQAWGLEPHGSTALGRDGNFFAMAWSRQLDGTWAATSLPRAPNSVESLATSAAYAPDGSLLVGGRDGTAATTRNTSPNNRPVVWQRVGTTWMSPVIYAIPAGATFAGARAINGQGQIAGNVDGSGLGAVWDSPTTPVRLDGLPVAINSAGNLLVGTRGSVSSGSAVYWWRDPVTLAWHTTGVPLPSIAGPSCTSGQAFGLNDSGMIVGQSCNADGMQQATVWTIDFSGSSPVASAPQALPGLGAKSNTAGVVSYAAGVNSTAPYVAAGMAYSNGHNYPVRWILR